MLRKKTSTKQVSLFQTWVVTISDKCIIAAICIIMWTYLNRTS